jgi:dTDP-4-dehydrorhamnose 3,5-epimerase
MKFVETPIAGVWIVELEPMTDERGYFARTWCEAEFQARGLKSRFVQSSVSFNLRRGTLRGMHYQSSPYEEAKLVRCTRGALYDVALDLRPQSATYGRWYAVELSEDNGRSIYIPEGCAHGFQTLRRHTEVSYQISEIFHPESARAVRWNDPFFQIQWPRVPHRTISARDLAHPDFTPGETCIAR